MTLLSPKLFNDFLLLRNKNSSPCLIDLLPLFFITLSFAFYISAIMTSFFFHKWNHVSSQNFTGHHPLCHTLKYLIVKMLPS